MKPDIDEGTVRVRKSCLRRSACLRMPGFVLGVAELFEIALIAFRLAGNADQAAVMNDLVGKIDPAVPRDHLHQFLFD